MKNSFKMESYFKDVMKDLDKGSEMQRKKAANYLKEKVKNRAMSIKDTGNLAKSTYVKHMKRSSYVGTKAPHSFLVEFGSSKSKPNPVVYNTFAEEAGTVERIMSEPWVK
jgi:HK97 gp10 family phage protein